MGVRSLWNIVSPTSRAVRLEALSRKRLAVDASIWIYQFLKAMRSKDGQKLSSSHIVGFFRRICKLLFFGIQPVFVFDGGAPALKRETISRRKERRLGKRESANNAAKRLLALQIQKQKEIPKKTEPTATATATEEEIEYHYLEDQQKSKEQLKEQEFANFKSTDEYHLPKIKGFEHSKSDSRLLGEEEFKDMSDHLDELDGIDLNHIDPGSSEFEALPLTTQYMVLSQLRLRSRLRLGYSKEQLEEIFPDSKDFSKFQIAMVAKRNFYTTRLMNLMDAPDKNTEANAPVRRVAGERDRAYKIQKTEGGWSLSLDGRGTSSNPINVEKEEKTKKPFEVDDSDSDIEWEDVPLNVQEKQRTNQSINSLPLPPSATLATSRGSGEGTIRSFSFSPKKKKQVSKVNTETDDDVFGEIERAELLEAIARSKVELEKQQQLEKSLTESKVKEIQDGSEESDSDGIFEDIAFDIPQGPDLKETLLSNGPSQPVRTPNPPKFKLPESRVRTEMDHLLNLAAPPKSHASPPKSHASPPGSSLVSSSDGKGDVSEERKPEVPSWFNSSFANPFKPNHDQQKDRQYDDDVGLVTFNEAQEILKIKERNLDNDGDDEVIELHEIDNDSSGEPGLVGTDLVTQKDDFNESESTRRDAVHQEFATKSNDSIKSSNVSPKPASPKPVSPEYIPSEHSNVIPQVLDYEFYESEEEELADQLDQEEAEHEQFQRSLNPNINTPGLHTLGSLSSLNKQRAKDLRDSDEVTIEMVKEVQELLAYFGIPYITAPMEAEAQCAELLLLNLVDGIITDDSDVFLFGGDKVYKNMFHEKHYVEYYDGKTIEKELGLDRGKLIELALLLGSDYTEGLKSIGPVNAMEILAEFGNLTEFRKWFMEGQFDISVQSKETTFQKKLRKKLIKSEVVLDNSFPDQRVKQAYVQPEVDSDKTDFKWGQPDLDKLRQFLMVNVGWSRERVDEVLVPLIKDLNKKKREGVQSTLGEFYEVEQSTFGGKKQKNKRVAEASAQIKRRKK